MTEINMFGWEMDEAGIVTLTMDDPTQGANTMNALFTSSLAATMDRLEAEKDKVNGVVITSAKKTFFAGGDLHDLSQATPADAQQVTDQVNLMKALLRRLETLGRPVVAAINGSALGGGLEIALACHHRVALDVKGSQIGLPEVTLGLLPGGGGVVRTVRMFGIQTALMNHLLQGQLRKPKDALAAGVVDELVSTPEELMHSAKTWALSNLEAVQPWDVKGYKIPGGTPMTPAFAANLPAFPANLRKQLKGAPMPAPHHIMAAAVEGAQVDFATAEKIETQYFVNLAIGPVSKNMIQAFFFDMQHISKGGDRPEGRPEVHRPEGGRARCRHDGRGHRLRVRPGRHGGRAQGHDPRRRGEGQGLLAGHPGQGRHPGQDDRRGARRGPGPDPADRGHGRCQGR